jgi:hypothetical protein
MFACAHPAIDAGVRTPFGRHAIEACGASDIEYSLACTGS